MWRWLIAVCVRAPMQFQTIFAKLPTKAKSAVTVYLDSKERLLFLLEHCRRALAILNWPVIDMIQDKFQYESTNQTIAHIVDSFGPEMAEELEGLPCWRPQYSPLYKICMHRIRQMFERNLLSPHFYDYQPFSHRRLLRSRFLTGTRYLVTKSPSEITISLNSPGWATGKTVTLTDDGLFARITDLAIGFLQFVHIPTGLAVTCDSPCDDYMQWFPSLRIIKTGS